MMIPVAIFVRLGGWPEGYYRIARIKYFVYFILDPDNTPIRFVSKMNNMKVKSPMHFNHSGNTYYPDKQNTCRSKGRPAWYFQRDQSVAIPIVTGNRDPLLNPITINKAYRIDVLGNLNKLKKDKSTHANYFLIAGLVIATILGILLAMRLSIG